MLAIVINSVLIVLLALSLVSDFLSRRSRGRTEYVMALTKPKRMIIAPTRAHALVAAGWFGLDSSEIDHVSASEQLRGLTLTNRTIFSVRPCEAEAYALQRGANVLRIDDSPVRAFLSSQVVRTSGIYE